MWTHRNCFSKNIPTSHEISEIARLKIAQSLKFGRTIAITGAGVSAAYGHLSWEELGKFIVLDTLDKAVKYSQDREEDIKINGESEKDIEVNKIVTEIRLIAQVLDEPEGPMLSSFSIKVDTALLQLCRYTRKLIYNETVNQVESENELDNMVRTLFSSSCIGRFKARLRCVSNISYKELIDTIEEKQKEENSVEINSDYSSYVELERDLFNELIKLKETEHNQIKEKSREIYNQLKSFDKRVLDSENLTSPDPYKLIVNNMGLSRFVTLNYDEEIEETFKRYGFSENTNPDNDLEHANQYIDGYGALLVSKAPTEESIGDLLVFSSTALENSATVFHLHGASTTATSSRDRKSVV